ncbi:DUF4065 domain-containing protein [bacterium]|nr:MAG: DUF4065 domain-containing protein [bacterium]
MSQNMSPKLMATIKYFIAKNNNSRQKDLSNKKLQKLLYYSQAWNLVFRKKDLFLEDFEAWVHGPAIPKVYREFKRFGSATIDMKTQESDFRALTDNDKKILDEVWKVYGKYDATYLEILSHNEEPWQNARSGCVAYDASDAIISKEEMKEYYGRKVKK